MAVSNNTRVILVYIICVVILGCDSQTPNIKDTIKGKGKSPLDVWFGNKTMINLLSEEVTDIMNRFTSRPVRSASGLPLTFYMKEIAKPAETLPRKISRVEINFINKDNQTVHTIQLQPSSSERSAPLRKLYNSKILPLI